MGVGTDTWAWACCNIEAIASIGMDAVVPVPLMLVEVLSNVTAVGLFPFAPGLSGPAPTSTVNGVVPDMEAVARRNVDIGLCKAADGSLWVTLGPWFPANVVVVIGVFNDARDDATDVIELLNMTRGNRSIRCSPVLPSVFEEEMRLIGAVILLFVVLYTVLGTTI